MAVPEAEVSVQYEGATVTLIVGENETVADLKTSIVQGGHFQAITEQGRLVLVAGERVLDNSHSLSSCGLLEGGVLHVELVNMLEVRVDRGGGDENNIIIEMSRDETVANLKMKISEQYHIAIGTQCLKQSGITLNDAAVVSSLRHSGLHSIELQLNIRFSLTIEVFTGVSFQLEVSHDERVDTLYAEVNRQARVPYHRQEIVYDNRVLEMGLRISDYNVPNQATLVVNLRNYEVMVFVKTLTGQTIMLTVTPRDTVAQVKAKIEQQEGIPIRKQRLIFVGEQLHDDHCFLDYRIEHESAVHLVIREGSSFEVYVRAPSGRSHVFEVDPKDSVQQLKNKLRDREGIPCDIQRFFYNNQLLDSDRSFTDIGIVSGSTLRLSIDQQRSTQIFVSVQSHDTFPLWVRQDHTIADVKEMITEKKGIAPDRQQLYFARNMLEDERTLQDYTIESNHMLHVHIVRPPSIQFTVTPQGTANGPLECEEQASQTVQDVKLTLSEKLNVPVNQQQLFLGGCELEDKCKLTECGITNGCNLDLILSESTLSGLLRKTVPSKAVLFVKTLTGKTIMVEVSPTDTVLAMKEQIQAQEGVDVNHQCLVCGGKILDNEMTVSDCGMQNQSMLHLVLRVPSQSPVTVVVEAGGQNFELTVIGRNTVRELKGEIEVTTGIPVADQTLKIAEVSLEDTEHISKYNVQEGTVIQVQSN